MIETEHPRYVEELFRQALDMKGSTYFLELAIKMSLLFTSSKDTRPSLSIPRNQSNDWFKMYSGKHLSSFEEPLDSEAHCEKLRARVLKNNDFLTCSLTPVAYLDEKWVED